MVLIVIATALLPVAKQSPGCVPLVSYYRNTVILLCLLFERN